MHSDVQMLLKLQAIDARLEILRKELEARPKSLASQGGEVDGMKQRKSDLQLIRTDKKVEADLLELESSSLEIKIQDARKVLNETTSEDRYKAIEQQVKRFEKEKEAEDDKLLVIYDEIDMIKNAEREILQELGVAEGHLSEDEELYSIDLEGIRSEAIELMAKREEALKNVPGEALDEYDLLFSRFRDNSVTSVEGGVCGGCHMQVSPQIVNQLRIAQKMIRCNNCTRILYI